MGQRIRGEDVSVQLIMDGAPQTTVTAIRSFEIEFQQDILSEGYLGENFERKDDTFKGVAGKMEYHVESADTLTVVQAMIDRAQRRTPGGAVQHQGHPVVPRRRAQALDGGGCVLWRHGAQLWRPC